MKFYYANSQNQTTGPVSVEELQELIRNGSLRSDPMVIPEGGSEWRLFSTFASPGNPGPAPGPGPRAYRPPVAGGSMVPFSRTILGDLVAAPLRSIKNMLSEGFTSRSLEFCRNAGQYAVLVGAALGLIYCIVTAIRGNQLMPALIGIGFVVALAIAQFVAMRFLSAGDGLIANTPHRISSTAFLECCGLFALLGGAGLLAAGILGGIQLGGMSAVTLIMYGLTNAIGLLYLAAVALNPQVVNIAIGSCGAGEEAVGLLGFFLKAFLKLLPIQFLLVGVGADLMMIGSFSSHSQPVPAFGGDPFAAPSVAPLADLSALNSMLGGYSGMALLLFACMLPFLGYFLFLLSNLGLEIIKAILSLTGKTEKPSDE